MNEDEYVFEYSLEQLTLQYLFSTLRRIPFYYFVALICICDLTQVFTSLYDVVYGAFRQAISPSPFTLFNQLVFFVHDAAMFIYVCTLGVVAVNRVVCVVFPVQFKALFTPRLSKALVGFCVIAGVSMSLPHLHPCCRLLSLPDWHMTTYYPFDTWYQYLDLFVSSLNAMLILVCYSVMFFVIRTSANYASLRDSPKNGEIRLTLQVFLMSAVNLLTFSMVFWEPYLDQSSAFGLIPPTMYAAQIIMNPTIAFGFNKAIRKEAISLFRPKNPPPRKAVSPAKTPTFDEG